MTEHRAPIELVVETLAPENVVPFVPAPKPDAGGAGGAGRGPEPPAAPPPDAPPPPRRFRGGYEGPLRRDGLPEPCPVVPLGKDGDTCWYLDALGQLRPLRDKEHQRLALQGLFGSQTDCIGDYWPKFDKDGDYKGPDWAGCADGLMQACARKGVWDVFGRVRGAGAWRDTDGALVLHCGDKITRSAAPDTPIADTAARLSWYDPGPRGGFVYPRLPRKPWPWDPPDDLAPVPATVAQDLLDTVIGTWNWRRPGVDDVLLLGWIAASRIGGALKVRPVGWISGEKATGKSTLHEVLQHLFGDWLLFTSDTTGAALWQKLAYSATPVAVDEAEAREDNRRTQGVIELARQAFSGGVVLRGGSDHKGTEFTARSCFLFSSILIPPMLGQDRSRLAILELEKLDAGSSPPRLDAAELRVTGAKLLRRMLDQWPRFDRTLTLYRAALLTAGHGGRGADQFGTLLACADLLLHDQAPDEALLADWAEKLKPQGLAELEDAGPDWRQFLDHLLSIAPPDLIRGGARRGLAHLVQEAGGQFGATKDWEPDPNKANEILSTFGLRVIFRGAGANVFAKPQRFLAIAVKHHALARLLEGTHWAARAGGTSPWSQSLARAPGSEAGTARFGGLSTRARFLPWGTVFEEEEGE